MKVILIRDVARLGKKSEIKDVPDGHAINFLIPRKLAIIANAENTKRVTHEKDTHIAHVAHAQKHFSHMLSKHKDTAISYAVDANEQGHLFKGVKAEDIITILNQHGFGLEKQHILLPHPLKEIGKHPIVLKMGSSTGEVTLEIIKK